MSLSERGGYMGTKDIAPTVVTSMNEPHYEPTEYHPDEIERKKKESEKIAAQRARELVNAQARRGRQITFAFALEFFKSLIPDFRNKNAGLTAGLAVATSMAAVPSLNSDKAIVRSMDQSQVDAFMGLNLHSDRIGYMDPTPVDLSKEITVENEALLRPEQYVGFEVSFDVIKKLLVEAKTGKELTLLPKEGIQLSVTVAQKEEFVQNFVNKLGNPLVEAAIKDQLDKRVTAANGGYSLQINMLPAGSADKVVLIPSLIVEQTLPIGSAGNEFPIIKGSQIILDGSKVELFLLKQQEGSIVLTVKAGDVMDYIKETLLSHNLPLPNPNEIALMEILPVSTSDSSLLQITFRGEKEPVTITYGDEVESSATSTPSPAKKIISTPTAPREVGFAKFGDAKFPSLYTQAENLSEADMATVSFTPEAITSIAVDIHSVDVPALNEIYLPTTEIPYFWKFVQYKETVIPVFWKANVSEGNTNIEAGWVRKTDTLFVKGLNLEVEIYAPIDPKSQSEQDWPDNFLFADTKLSEGVTSQGENSYVSFGKWIEDNFKGNANLSGKIMKFYLLPKVNNQIQQNWLTVNGIVSYASGVALAKEQGKEVIDVYGYYRWNSPVVLKRKPRGVSTLIAGAVTSIAQQGLIGNGKPADVLKFMNAQESFSKALPDTIGTDNIQKTFIILEN